MAWHIVVNKKTCLPA